MRKIAIVFGFLVSFIVCGRVTGAWAADYTIDNFTANIVINQNESLDVSEKIETNFLIEKHGIYRVIPYIYSAKGKTIRTELAIESVTNDRGANVPYSSENYNQSKRIKIGDANKMVIGRQNYLIKYRVTKVIQDYGDGPELYWNVTGSEWEVPVEKASAVVDSNFADINKIECFGCKSSFDKKKAVFTGTESLTIVVGMDKNNQLVLPTEAEKTAGLIADNWGYGLAVFPMIFMGVMWFYKGRDKRYLTENVFYKPDNEKEKRVPLLSRPHLPMVYGPIDKLSPGEVGTIVDEKADTKDIVAEIVELARLKYMTIEKIEKKVLWITERDYKFTKLEKANGYKSDLNEFETYLLDKLFGSKNEVKVSELMDHFYVHMNTLRDKIYKDLEEKKMTDGNLVKVKAKWSGWATILNIVVGYMLISLFVSKTGNGGPLVPFFVGGLVSYLFAIQMPRKTAWGYSLHRQAVGLQYYLRKGKWREEIAEKKLFLEEMLPLAIALGVVSQLASDMRDLEVEPPSYFNGIVLSSFVSDMNNFSGTVGAGLVTSPSSSGSGSWSGGSGFSGGGGGGGFGGGGGGSW